MDKGKIGSRDDQSRNPDTETSSTWENWQVWLICVVAISGIAAIFLLVMKVSFVGLEERGQFGDQFGALNSIFSGFAFCGMLIALYLQRKDLKLQRHEMELNRTEAKKQTQQFVHQSEINSKMLEMQELQSMEDSFHKSVSTLLSIRNSWKIKAARGYEEGGYAIQLALIAIQGMWIETRSKRPTGKVVEFNHLAIFYTQFDTYANIYYLLYTSIKNNDKLLRFLRGMPTVIELKMLMFDYAAMRHNDKDYYAFLSSVYPSEVDDVVFQHRPDDKLVCNFQQKFARDIRHFQRIEAGV